MQTPSTANISMFHNNLSKYSESFRLYAAVGRLEELKDKDITTTTVQLNLRT